MHWSIMIAVFNRHYEEVSRGVRVLLHLHFTLKKGLASRHTSSTSNLQGLADICAVGAGPMHIPAHTTCTGNIL